MKKLLAIALALFISLAFVACDESDDTDDQDVKIKGIVGEWYSSGDNVSVLLSYYFSVDSIYANFKSDNTYLVESFSDGAKTTYTGTFTQEESGVGSIWNIVLNQSSPTAVVSEGIFEINKDVAPYTMQYEVAQTTPSIGATAPTAEAGFGSTSGGELGTTNIQNFIKIED